MRKKRRVYQNARVVDKRCPQSPKFPAFFSKGSQCHSFSGRRFEHRFPLPPAFLISSRVSLPSDSFLFAQTTLSALSFAKQTAIALRYGSPPDTNRRFAFHSAFSHNATPLLNHNPGNFTDGQQRVRDVAQPEFFIGFLRRQPRSFCPSRRFS